MYYKNKFFIFIQTLWIKRVIFDISFEKKYSNLIKTKSHVYICLMKIKYY
jgi:hypothetical protein